MALTSEGRLVTLASVSDSVGSGGFARSLAASFGLAGRRLAARWSRHVVDRTMIQDTQPIQASNTMAA